MNTVIGLIFALAKIKGDIPLDRIGTHPLENFFGLLRRILHDCNRFDELLHAVARTMVVDEVFEDLGHPRDICGRKNVGGVVCKFDPECPDLQVDPEPTYKNIINLVNDLLHGSTGNIKNAPGMKWLREFNEASMTDAIRREGTVLLRITSSNDIMSNILQRMSR
jgi:hypothetical protein